MQSRRYLKDYTLQETLGPDGRVRTEGVYNGPVFRLEEGEALRKARVKLLLLAAVSLAAVLTPLVITVPIIRVWYVMIPLVLALAPAVRLAVCAVRLQRKTRFTRKERDATAGALAPWSVAQAALAFLSLAGQVIHALRGAFTARDAPVPVAAGALLLAAAGMFAIRKSFDAAEEAADP